MTRSKAAKQRGLIAPDGRKILDTCAFRDDAEKRVTERALKIVEERDKQSAARSLGLVPMLIKSCKTTAVKPDFNGYVEKAIEISATIAYSKAALALLTDHMQETIVADLKPKQLMMNLQHKRPNSKIALWDLPEAIQTEAQQLVCEDLDIKEALGDLCLCGHTRADHLEELEVADGDTRGGRDIVARGGEYCRVENCDCVGFIPLPPGDEPTSMMDSDDAETDSDAKDEEREERGR